MVLGERAASLAGTRLLRLQEPSAFSGIKERISFGTGVERSHCWESVAAGIKAALYPGPGAVPRRARQGSASRPGGRRRGRSVPALPGASRCAPAVGAPGSVRGAPRGGRGRAGRWPGRAGPQRGRELRGTAGAVRRALPRGPRPPRGASPAPPCGGVPGALRFSHKSGPSPWERAILHRALLTENEKQTGPEINHGAERLHKGRLCVNRAGRGGQLPAARTRTGPRPAGLGAARGGGQVGAAPGGPLPQPPGGPLPQPSGVPARSPPEPGPDYRVCLFTAISAGPAPALGTRETNGAISGPAADSIAPSEAPGPGSVLPGRLRPGPGGGGAVRGGSARQPRCAGLLPPRSGPGGALGSAAASARRAPSITIIPCLNRAQERPGQQGPAVNRAQGTPLMI